MIRDLLSNRLYSTGLDFEHVSGYPDADGCVLSIPGAYWCDQYDNISEALSRYDWVLGVRVGDEEDLFDIDRVEHPNIAWWVQTPRRDYRNARTIGVGYPPHFKGMISDPPDKLLDVFLSAQNTHARRRECFATLEGVAGRVEATTGFTKGMPPAEYARAMLQARVAPCPSGAVSVDSFRMWEALETHAIPVVDTVSPVDGPTDYWHWMFGGVPFPLVTGWEGVDWVALLEDWPANANAVTAWWMRRKREYAQWLREDLTGLGAL